MCVKNLVLPVILTMFLASTAFSTSILESNQNQLNEFIDLDLQVQFPEYPTEDVEFNIKLSNPDMMAKRCDQTLSMKWRNAVKPGSNTLNVSCGSPQWQLYIPISVQVFRDVVVSVEPLSRANPIELNQLKTQRLEISKLRLGYFTDISDLKGYLPQRTVKAGHVLTPYILKAPSLIKRGDWVTIISGRKGLTITSTGEAMKDGVFGEQIPIKNVRSDITVRAWVLKKGLVTTKKDLI
jgi:flagella basal body P-ring formation protein FlgA